ncbi:MAG: 2-oxo acid dehydrogenase subunit E2 [Bacterioplanes sp.]|nr:2-oxo acid dehydrogenase subunit E2 [Bacterioplanes sp.]
MSHVTCKVPDLGGANSVDVVEWLVQVGDVVTADQPVLVLETDKASMEINAEHNGKVLACLVDVGQKIKEGDAFLTIEESQPSEAAAESEDKGNTVENTVVADSAADNHERQADAIEDDSTAQPSTPEPLISARTPLVAAVTNEESAQQQQVHAGPVVRKLARELGVGLQHVSGTGVKGRISKEDIQRYVKERLQAPLGGQQGGLPSVPDIDFSQFGPIREQPLNAVKRATAKAMRTAWLNVPQVTQFDRADITDLEAYRQKQNARYAKHDLKFSIVPFVLKALAKCLQEFPSFNASLSADGQSLILKDYIHIGVAVDTPKGLLVPIINDVNEKTVTEITQELMLKAERARAGKLSLAEMQGGSFSLSSLGGIGGTAFTPIVNPPEVGILGLSKAEMQPIWNGSSFEPRLMLPLSLSYDHRVVDGAEAARFSQRLVAYLQDLRDVLM